ncbi:MAG TPA: DUF5688 family protein [Lachnospiraceae bacterium]|nr:DUF5688 family protein [Lachnospiraceae bacterium]
MEFNEFVEKVCKSVQEYMGEEVMVTINQVIKNNGICLEGMIIAEKDNNISPTIYLNGYFEEYREGKIFSDIFNEIIQIYQESKVGKNINMDFFLDYKLVKEKIAYKIINYDKNLELLEQIPHMKYLDLAIVFYCLIISEQFSGASITIHNSHLKMWNVTIEELFAQAKKNTPKLLHMEIKNMNQILNEMLHENDANDIPEEWCEELNEELNEQLSNRNEENLPMYVLTNQSKTNGATCMLYDHVLEGFSIEVESDLYILPSSIHEVILIPTKDKRECDKFANMVKEVNETQVEVEEVLSDHVYYFSRLGGEVSRL